MTTSPLWTAPPGTTGLIFDCDGTLVDTMPAHHRAWLAMLADHGVPFPAARFYGTAGMPGDRIIPLLAAEAGVALDPAGIPAMVRRKEALFAASIDAVEPIEVVCAIARRYCGVLPMAVASGGERPTITATLAAIGIAPLFGAVVTAEDTERHKPEPDVFLEAARRLGVAPAGCVVFEDSDLGLEAARRAGMVGVDIRPWRTPSAG